ncbi:MAG TPA: PDDEXK nuclease domain-containing protein [Puia sp.]|nr:PDDEXK nuclease domain-containing protein [Puia sp.]
MERKYLQFIKDLKQSIIQSRYQAARLVNREQLLLYYKTGKMLSEKITKEKWGAKVLEQISVDIQKQIPGIRGFSLRNLKNMRQFFETYELSVIGQTLSAQLQSIGNHKIKKTRPSSESIEGFFSLSFSHHIALLNKCATNEERLFYVKAATNESWSLSVLEHHIDGALFEKKGKLPNNFSQSLSGELKVSAVEAFNDEYLMDYMNLGDGSDEREVENKIVTNVRNFILRMGKGFSFIGNQFRLELDGEEFFIDLLFYNRHLQCLVAFELKRDKFRPEYAGQLNFYLNVLDEKIKLPHENSSIGIVLCKEKNNTVVEFSVKTIDKPMGVATFRMTKKIPDKIRNVLPDAGELKNLLI